MISTEELEQLHPDIWESLSHLFSGRSNNPCLFATASFKKNIMKFVIVEKKSDVIKYLSSQLVCFSEKLKEERDFTEKTFNTLVLISREDFQNKNEEDDFIDNILINLHSVNPCEWPIGKTKNTNDQDFEFYWNGISWFPVLLHKTHTQIIRKSKFLTIGFQPGDAFDFIKKSRTEFYERMRAAIHSRISNSYPEKLPFYLSRESSGKNICQYSGFDKNENSAEYKYPILK